MSGHLLVVDDDQDMCALLAVELGTRGFEITWRTSGAEALDVIAATDVDALLTDIDMAGMSGIELCERVVSHTPDLPITMLTAHDTLEVAVAAMRAGARDFVAKPPDLDALAEALARAIRGRGLAVADVAEGFAGLLGASRPMRRVHDLLTRAAASNAPVLVIGETGTGKELVARALHVHGPRRGGPFVAVNCAAVPGNLLESELFGHARGAFTDARAARLGLFTQADGGTLFLDEIGDLPLSLQPKLLRALQERAVRPVGGQTEVPCDVRLITATNQDLEAAVQAGRFREDIYFRINVIQIRVPPLRERGEDVHLLARHFMRRAGHRAGKALKDLSPAVRERLVSYPWPGNVRELENCMEQAVALTRHAVVVIDDLPERLQRAAGPTPAPPLAPLPSGPDELLSLAEAERRHILAVLAATNGNRSRAATILEVDRKTLSRKLRRYRASV